MGMDGQALAFLSIYNRVIMETLSCTDGSWTVRPDLILQVSFHLTKFNFIYYFN